MVRPPPMRLSLQSATWAWSATSMVAFIAGRAYRRSAPQRGAAGDDGAPAGGRAGDRHLHRLRLGQRAPGLAAVLDGDPPVPADAGDVLGDDHRAPALGEAE